MAKKAAAKKSTKKADQASGPKTGESSASEPLDPKAVHALFGLPGPYDDKDVPIPTKDFVTFWDCGMSLHEMRRRKQELFSHCDWLDGQRFAKDSDSWKWRQIDLTPFDLGKPFDPKATDLPLARELVSYLILHALATGVRLEIPRLRCKDVMPSGLRVCVGPWRDRGLEIANVSDRWSSPDMGCCSLYTPLVNPKRK